MLDAQTTAPAGPSMQDTAQWIVKNLMSTGFDRTEYVSHLTYGTIRANIDSCVLIYSAHYSSENTGNHRIASSWDETHTFHLGAITQVLVSRNNWGFNVVAYLSSQADKVTYANINENPPGQRPAATNMMLLPFGLSNGQDNNDLSTRMQKALTHAAELCAASYKEGNGKEPF